ncbi:hypothetical protein AVEN_176336-1 [Araneus ventricosus]|uniref:Uncharacterized protein n=1 Tax=Araneus ventricosus TaxID=182803 RepID=A0A4Y2KM15_ARAVE|nr:hypothetical protein AVEN_176336-1 [Araneus ventricosus]
MFALHASFRTVPFTVNDIKACEEAELVRVNAKMPRVSRIPRSVAFPKMRLHIFGVGNGFLFYLRGLLSFVDLEREGLAAGMPIATFCSLICLMETFSSFRPANPSALTLTPSTLGAGKLSRVRFIRQIKRGDSRSRGCLIYWGVAGPRKKEVEAVAYRAGPIGLRTVRVSMVPRH